VVRKKTSSIQAEGGANAARCVEVSELLNRSIRLELGAGRFDPATERLRKAFRDPPGTAPRSDRHVLQGPPRVGLSGTEEDDRSSEGGSLYGDLRKIGKEKRALNRANSAHILTSRGVKWRTKNNGEHLIVDHGGESFDFWPGTGKWKQRGVPDGVVGRGVFNLLRRMRVP